MLPTVCRKKTAYLPLCFVSRQSSSDPNQTTTSGVETFRRSGTGRSIGLSGKAPVDLGPACQAVPTRAVQGDIEAVEVYFWAALDVFGLDGL